MSLACGFETSARAGGRRVWSGRRRDGRVHRLKLETAPMQQVQQWIEEYRRFWEESFDRPGKTI